MQSRYLPTSAITHKEAKAKTEPKAAHGSNNPFDKENRPRPSAPFVLEKRVMNVIDIEIEDEDDTNIEDYLPLPKEKRMHSVWRQH